MLRSCCGVVSHCTLAQLCLKLDVFALSGDSPTLLSCIRSSCDDTKSKSLVARPNRSISSRSSHLDYSGNVAL
jgi:hypothetical protein